MVVDDEPVVVLVVEEVILDRLAVVDDEPVEAEVVPVVEDDTLDRLAVVDAVVPEVEGDVVE